MARIMSLCVLFLFFISCGHFRNKENDFDNIYIEYKSKNDTFIFNISNNTLSFKNVYEFSISPNKKNLIITKGELGKNVEVYKCEIDKLKCKKLTKNNFIEFSPVINDNGLFAYCLHEYSVSQSKILLNNDILEFSTDGCFYDNLAISNKYLVFRKTCFSLSPEDTIIGVYDILRHRVTYIPFKDCFAEKILPYNDNLFFIQSFCKNTNSTDLFILNATKKEIYYITNSTNDELVFYDNYKFYFISVPIKQKGKFLFNVFYYFFNSQLSNPFSKSNNFLGRISWNVSYRLLALANLYNKTHLEIIKNIIDNTINNLLLIDNYHLNIVDDYNPNYAYTSKKYSIDKQTPTSFMVHDGLIYYSIFKALEVIPGLKNKYGKILKEHFLFEYNYWNKFFDNELRLYKQPYGSPVWFDGIWLPFNM